MINRNEEITNIKIYNIDNDFKDIRHFKTEFLKNEYKGLIVDLKRSVDKKFLEYCNDIIFLNIRPITNQKDLNYIYKLVKLKILYLNGFLIKKKHHKLLYPNEKIHNELSFDFNKFINLISLSISGEFNNKNILNIKNCIKLKELYLNEYRDKDLEIFSGLENLKELRIENSSIKSLKGIEKLENLEYLSLGYLLSLRDISHISSLKNLKQLTIDTCSKIYDYDALSGLDNLEEIDISNNRDIKDLKFLPNLKKLKLFRMGESSNIVDGDLSYTDNIKEAYFPSRKHYNR